MFKVFACPCKGGSEQVKKGLICTPVSIDNDGVKHVVDRSSGTLHEKHILWYIK